MPLKKSQQDALNQMARADRMLSRSEERPKPGDPHERENGPTTLDLKAASKPHKVPIWDKKLAAVRRTHTTPRDFFEREWDKVEAPDEVHKHVVFRWLPDWMFERNFRGVGFDLSLFEPVTKEMMKEYDIRVTVKDRDKNGVPRAGMDCSLFWIPRKLHQEMLKVQIGDYSRPVAEQMKMQEESWRQAISGDDSGAIGDIQVSRSDVDHMQQAQEEMAAAHQAQREELGERMTSPV